MTVAAPLELRIDDRLRLRKEHPCGSRDWLVVRLGADLQPRSSLHSRADGIRHGICSVIEHAGQLMVASRGGDCLIMLTTGEGAKQ